MKQRDSAWPWLRQKRLCWSCYACRKLSLHKGIQLQTNPEVINLERVKLVWLLTTRGISGVALFSPRAKTTRVRDQPLLSLCPSAEEQPQTEVPCASKDLIPSIPDTSHQPEGRLHCLLREKERNQRTVISFLLWIQSLCSVPGAGATWPIMKMKSFS